MNDIKFANKIRQALNEGSQLHGERGARIAERLRVARERALARQLTVAREPSLALAPGSAANMAVNLGGTGDFSLRLVLAGALLAAGLIAMYVGQQDQRAADVEEIDALLLTDDLPIDAYLDRGFEAWLKKVARH
jgi:hypothetical protein